jgi:hypothetical protein
MTNTVHVPFGENMAETATLLLAAAEETKNEAYVVVVDHFTNSYRVPEEVAKKAGLDSFDPDADFAADVAAAQDSDLSIDASNVEGERFPEEPKPQAPAKKAAAKRTAKKTAKKS